MLPPITSFPPVIAYLLTDKDGNPLMWNGAPSTAGLLAKAAVYSSLAALAVSVAWYGIARLQKRKDAPLKMPPLFHLMAGTSAGLLALAFVIVFLDSP